MPLSETLLNEIRQHQRRPADWFSIDEIKRRDRDLEIAARYVQTTTGKEWLIRRSSQELFIKLEDWAARLLENEVRLYEQKIGELCSENSSVPTPQNDMILRDAMIQYIKTSVEALKGEISHFSQHTPERWYPGWSKLDNSAKHLIAEMSVTIPLAGEIARLEMLDSGYEPIDKIGYAQIKIERFLSENFSTIQHPFTDDKSLNLSAEDLKRAIRLILHVIYKDVEEPRLNGFKEKFIAIFLRYLSCSRESSGAVAEQVSALLEPFLKKLSFLFELCDTEGNSICRFALDGLIRGLDLSSADLKKTDNGYWRAQSVEDGVLRVAYQLRHKGVHEAHKHAYYVHERYAYFVFAAIVVACKILIQAKPEFGKIIEYQENVDALRDLFVMIDELTIGPDGPRLSSSIGVPPTRLQKLVSFSDRAKAVWPNCTATLHNLLESEYISVKSELTDADREANIESYLESMRDDEY